MKRRGWYLLGLLMVGVAAASAQNVSEQYLLAAANQDRASRGIGPLHTDAQLNVAARLHALEMVRHGAISHRFAGEADLPVRAGQAGAHFSLVTENVAEAQNAAQIHELWMHSPGHRANLLDDKVDALGIAVIEDRGQLYAVEDFARSVEQVSLAQQEGTVAGLIGATGVAIAPTTPDARKTCAMATGYAGQRQPSFVMRYTSADLDRLPAELTSRLQTGKYHEAEIGACMKGKQGPFTSYNVAVLLYP